MSAKRHPSYVRGDICLTATCGNRANPDTLFCEDCVPVQPGLLVRVIRIPFALLASVLGV